MITVITAADSNFKEFVEKCADSSKQLNYKTLIYDLGGLGYGIPFKARVSPKVGAKIPSKPSIIQDALGKVEKGDIVAWLDADTILWERFDEIAYGNYDIGVTVRQPKQTENGLPINAGVVFVRKTRNAKQFVKQWIELCETGVSDQVELNKLAQVSSNDANSTVQRGNIKIKAFECNIYNNFYFKKTQLHAKIIHYKSKHRYRWPERTIKKIPKGFAGDRSPYVQTK